MTTKHTPGPWIIGAFESGKAAVDGPNGEEVTGWVELRDAHLISAAPDLLAACEALLAGSSKAAPLARIAIEKAKGGAA